MTPAWLCLMQKMRRTGWAALPSEQTGCCSASWPWPRHCHRIFCLVYSFTCSCRKQSHHNIIAPHDQPLMLAAGITKLAHLQVALQQQHPPAITACLHSVLATIPPPWQAIVAAAPTAPVWQQGLSASGSQLIQNTQT